MLKAELPGVQGKSLQTELLTQATVQVEVAIDVVTSQGVLTRGGLDADLVCATGNEGDIDER